MKKSVIAVLLSVLAGHACAVGNLAAISVYDRAENRTLPIYYHQGRYFIAGKPGNEYQINVRNNESAEILAVVSVDGVNAVSGETANWSQGGYVLGPHAGFNIKGWRKSLQRVAAFFFTEIDNSYAARTGRRNNVGVIGVAVFRKRPDAPVGALRDHRQRADAPAAANAGESESRSREVQSSTDAVGPRVPGMSTQPMVEDKTLGTGHGKSEASVVRWTNFERASQGPDEVITIYYDSYRNLLAQGVIHEAPRIARPSPFPGRFVPDPR